VNSEHFWNSAAGGQAYCVREVARTGHLLAQPANPLSLSQYKRLAPSLPPELLTAKKSRSTVQATLLSDPEANYSDSGTHNTTNNSMSDSHCYCCHLVVMSQVTEIFVLFPC
jgi:hypothetical protein